MTWANFSSFRRCGMVFLHVFQVIKVFIAHESSSVLSKRITSVKDESGTQAKKKKKEPLLLTVCNVSRYQRYLHLKHRDCLRSNPIPGRDSCPRRLRKVLVHRPIMSTYLDRYLAMETERRHASLSLRTHPAPIVETRRASFCAKIVLFIDSRGV